VVFPTPPVVNDFLAYKMGFFRGCDFPCVFASRSFRNIFLRYVSFKAALIDYSVFNRFFKGLILFKPTVGKTAEFGLYSHSGHSDGPVGETPSSKDPIDGNQMGMAGWSNIDFNWSKGARADFYGCNTGYNSESSPSWTTRISALSNFKDVDVVGETSYSYPSRYTNYRENNVQENKFILSRKDGTVTFKRTYQVGGILQAWGNDRNVVNPVRHSTNGKGTVGGYFPGDQKP
jgi:hypothetical protein